MRAAKLIIKARAASGLSQRELAHRAGTSAAAICGYETGSRIPRFDTLERIVEAAGAELICSVQYAPHGIDLERNARVLEEVLDLAEHLPHRPDTELGFPPLAATARPA